VPLPAGFKFDPAGSPATWQKIKELCDGHHTCLILVEGYLPEGKAGDGRFLKRGTCVSM
jgi:hypothetical protein